MKYKIFALVGLIFLIFSCREVFEEDISSNQVILTAPGNNLQSRTYKQSFFWENILGARNYRLQIAQPSFDSIKTMVLDTLLSNTKYIFSMSPGKYQWRVRGENGGYQGIYSFRNIEIFPSSLSKQQVILNAPVNQFLTNKNQIFFNWAGLFGATSYILQLDTNNFVDTTKLILNQQIKETALSYTTVRDQKYQWRVRGINDTARSEWSVVQQFTIDTKPSGKVILVSPANNDSVNPPVNLSWQSLSDAKQYELFVYRADSVSLVATFPKMLTAPNYNFTEANSGDKIVWRVRARDAAGNISVFSDFRSFLIR